MANKPSNYQISSRDYLKRARKLLDSGSQENLFYAAFELRCGVEARLQEYLEVQEEISQKKKRGWKIAKLAKNLEKIFRIDDTRINIQIFKPDGKEHLITLSFIPVSSKLRKNAEKLGDYLHAMKKYRKSTDAWWDNTPQFFEEIYGQLKLANEGNLFGPPMVNPKTGRGIFRIEVPEGIDPKEIISAMSGDGQKITMKVEHIKM